MYIKYCFEYNPKKMDKDDFLWCGLAGGLITYNLFIRNEL